MFLFNKENNDLGDRWSLPSEDEKNKIKHDEVETIITTRLSMPVNHRNKTKSSPVTLPLNDMLQLPLHRHSPPLQLSPVPLSESPLLEPVPIPMLHPGYTYYASTQIYCSHTKSIIT